MAEVPDANRYVGRTSGLSRTVTYTMLADRLLVEKGGSATAIPYGDVTSLRVFDTLTAQRELIKRCELRSPRRKLVLQSLHAAGVFREEDRLPEFRAFLAELVRRVGSANPAVALLAGQTGLFRFWSYLTMALLVVGAVSGVAIMVAGDLQGVVLVVVCLVGFVTMYGLSVGKGARRVDRDAFLRQLGS